MKAQEHILSDFDGALKSLSEKTLLVGNLTLRNVENAMTGLLQRNRDLCNQVIADDSDVDQLHHEVDGDGILLMTKYHPFASDLRIVVSSMRTASNFERISDHAEDIARNTRKLLKTGDLQEICFVEPLFIKCRDTLKKAITSYADGSLELAEEVLEDAKECRKLEKVSFKKLIHQLENEDMNERGYLNLIFTVRWLERIAALCENVGEDVIFMRTSKDIRVKETND